MSSDFIQITKAKSAHFNQVFEVRQLSASGAITKDGDLYFRAHEYEEVCVVPKKELEAREAELADLRHRASRKSGRASTVFVVLLIGLLVWSFYR